MKKLFFVIFVALNLVGCSALISVGDNNTNTSKYNKDLKWNLLTKK